MATPDLVESFRALARGDRTAALLAARRDDASLLAYHLASYLEGSQAAAPVYDQPEAFQAFIAGGGNVALYEATAAALAAIYDTVAGPSIVDIGCGDGAALVPALTLSTTVPSRIDLVEVASGLLDTALRRLRGIGLSATPHRATAQDFAARLRREQRWDIAESTFALHTVPVVQRSHMLTQLRGHIDQIVLVEFDVPAHEPNSDEHFNFLADTYERGLAEYGSDRALVAEGFLMPVLVGQLAPDAIRVTYEQSRTSWIQQLEECGYRRVESSELYPYWSSPAFLLTARST